jgi:hypothetical protein
MDNKIKTYFNTKVIKLCIMIHYKWVLLMEVNSQLISNKYKIIEINNMFIKEPIIPNLFHNNHSVALDNIKKIFKKLIINNKRKISFYKNQEQYQNFKKIQSTIIIILTNTIKMTLLNNNKFKM